MEKKKWEMQVYYCKHCAETGKNLEIFGPGLGLDALELEKINNFHRGYLFLPKGAEGYGEKCMFCGADLVDTQISYDDMLVIGDVSNENRELLEEMIKLRNEDIIAYETKMLEFRKYHKELEEEKNNTPKCPYCNSKDLVRISEFGKALKVGFFGLRGADDLGKTWECQNCGSKF